MRFQPTIVPKPSAIATEIFTHNGINLVAASVCSLNAFKLSTVSLSIFSNAALSF